MWHLFDQCEPNRHESVLVWCAADRCVKHIEDFRSEEASNNWLLWLPCPSPSVHEIDRADRRAADRALHNTSRDKE